MSTDDVKTPAARRPRAYLRKPPRSLAAGERTFLERRPIDFALACEQHAAYARALVEGGYDVTVLDALDEHADSCFVEDPALYLRECVLFLRPGAASRVDELAALRTALAPQHSVQELAQGALEGGDVLAIDDTLWVGQSTRSDHAGLKALAHHVLDHGLRVKAVDVHAALHLKTAVTYLGRDTLLANPAWADIARFGGLHVIEVDAREPGAANALPLADHVLVSASFPLTAERLRAAGFPVRSVELSEFEKAEAGATCLSLRELDV